MGNEEMWPYLFAFTAIPSILQMLCMPFMLKIPRYLLIDQHKEDEARTALVQLRGTDNVVDEMDGMRQEAESGSSAEQLTIVQLFKERAVRWQLITVLVMMVVQQLSGINAVAVIEWAGRKSLLVRGFGMMVFWCIAMTVVLNLLATIGGWISYLSIACVIGYVIGFAIGPGPIPWLVTAELFRQAARPLAFMVGCLVNWGCNFLIGVGFPALNKVTGPWVFLIFMVVCTFATAFFSIVLPETKGKTFQEISNLFAKRNGVRESDPNAGDSSAKIPFKESVDADPAGGDGV